MDTWELKLNFARRQCLGGAMGWAISQDSLDGRFSKELQSVTGYKSRAVDIIKTTLTSPGPIYREKYVSEPSADVTKEQCRWTNCGAVCPSGWTAVLRRDLNNHIMGELMLDGTGCDGDSVRTFCCPPGDQPFCQWLHFNGGNCNPGCPNDWQFEVASTTAGCNNGLSQVACCEGEMPSMDIYRQCKWFSSSDQRCWKSDGDRRAREYCCDTSDHSEPHWANCALVDTSVLGLTAVSYSDSCSGSCPAGKIKTSLDEYPMKCKHGRLATCCDAHVTAPVADEFVGILKDALDSWVKNPACPNNDRIELSTAEG